MSTAGRRNTLLSSAFAGVLLWCGVAAHPASAQEAARTDETRGCAVISPRYEPGPRHGSEATPDLARTPGGAKLRWLVGEPCLRAARPHDA